VVKVDPAARAAIVGQVGRAVQRVAARRAHAGVALSVDVDPQ
jgi:hypothetical protein